MHNSYSSRPLGIFSQHFIIINVMSAGIQRGKAGKGGCWLAEVLLNADKRSTCILKGNC